MSLHLQQCRVPRLCCAVKAVTIKIDVFSIRIFMRRRAISQTGEMHTLDLPPRL